MLGAAQAQQIFTGLDWISDKYMLFPSDAACDDELLSLRGTNADFNILILLTHPSKHNYPENKQIQELSVGYQCSRHPEEHGRCCLTMAQYFFLVSIQSLFSNESTLHTRCPKYWSFSFSIIPSKEIPGLISLQSKGPSRVFSNITLQTHQFFGA